MMLVRLPQHKRALPIPCRVSHLHANRRTACGTWATPEFLTTLCCGQFFREAYCSSAMDLGFSALGRAIDLTAEARWARREGSHHREVSVAAEPSQRSRPRAWRPEWCPRERANSPEECHTCQVKCDTPWANMIPGRFAPQYAPVSCMRARQLGSSPWLPRNPNHWQRSHMSQV